MFYQTTLQSVKNGVAVDIQGKQLRFIGYLQVQAGDTVWTDGNVIFGNVPPKSTPNIAEPLKGVPVLGDDLRGYIKKSGNYRQKNIIEDNWIVNNSRHYKHGGDENLLDVELITKITTGSYDNTPILYKADTAYEDSVVRFYRDDTLEEEIDLDNGFNIAEQKASYIANEIVGGNTERFKRVIPYEVYSDDYSAGRVPRADINKTKIMGLKIDSEGSSHAIVASWRSFSYEVYAYNKTHSYKFYVNSETNNYKVGDTSAESFLSNLPSVPDLIDDLVTRITDIEERIYTYDYKDLGVNEFYARNTGSKDLRYLFTCFSYELTYFKNWQFEKTIDRNSFQTFFDISDHIEEEVSTSPDGFYKGKVGTQRKVIAASTAWHTIIVLEDTDDTQDYYQAKNNIKSLNSGSSDETLFNVFAFPLQDGYTAEMTIWQIKAIFDENGNQICGELPIQESSAFLEDYVAFESEKGVDVDWNKKRRIYADNSTETVAVASDYSNYQCGIFYYDDDGEKQDYLMPNVSVTKLSEKKYLVGFHKGNLYLIDDGDIKRITENENDKLKNFRLREMKNLNKAKRG